MQARALRRALLDGASGLLVAEGPGALTMVRFFTLTSLFSRITFHFVIAPHASGFPALPDGSVFMSSARS